MFQASLGTPKNKKWGSKHDSRARLNIAVDTRVLPHTRYQKENSPALTDGWAHAWGAPLPAHPGGAYMRYVGLHITTWYTSSITSSAKQAICEAITITDSCKRRLSGYL